MPKGYDLYLNDGRYEVGLKFADGSVGAAMRDIPDRPSTLRVTRGDSKFGDWDPNFSHIGQRDWSGGRGQDDFFDDPTRFYDASAWTLTEGKVLPAMQWQISTGLRDKDENMPGDLAWRELHGVKRYYSTQFTAGQSYSIDKTYLWIKRVGSPATLTVELCTNSGSNPNTVLKTTTVTTSTVTDIISLFYAFDHTGTQAVTSGTAYHIKIYGASTDNASAHWEVGVDSGTSASLTSSDNSAWVSSGDKAYYRAVVADVDTKWHTFFLGTEMFAISEPASGSSALYIWNESTDNWDAQAMDSGDALAGTVTSVAVVNGIAHMARGTGNKIWTFRNNSGSYEGQNDTASYADMMLAANKTVWRYVDSTVTVSVSDVQAFNTDLIFGPDIPCGETTYKVTAMTLLNSVLQIRKQNSLGFVFDGVYVEDDVGLDAVFETGSSNAMVSVNKALYFSWSHSVERLFEGILDDIGPWKGTGMPTGRTGVVSAILPVIGWQFWSIDAGGGTSSVLGYNGQGLGEVFRAPEASQSIEALAWQPVANSNPRLWISCGSDLFYINFPQDTLSPQNDSSVNYMHESYLEYSLVDMGAAELKKLFHEFTILSKNLTDDIKISVDIQLDDKIGLTGWSNWKGKGTLIDSPTDTVSLNEGDVKSIRIRLRIETNDADVPPIISATTLEGVARIPERRLLSFLVVTHEYQVTRNGAPDKLPSTILDYLSSLSKAMRVVRMRSDIKEYRDVPVLVDTITPRRENIGIVTGEAGGTLSFTVRVL